MDMQDIASTLDGLGNPTRLDIYRLLVRAGGSAIWSLARMRLFALYVAVGGIGALIAAASWQAVL